MSRKSAHAENVYSLVIFFSQGSYNRGFYTIFMRFLCDSFHSRSGTCSSTAIEQHSMNYNSQHVLKAAEKSLAEVRLAGPAESSGSTLMATHTFPDCWDFVEQI